MLPPRPMRSGGRDMNRDARRLREPLMDPIGEHLVGVRNPLARMHEVEQRFYRKSFDKTSVFGDVFVDSPPIRAVAAARVSQLVDGAQELRTVLGVDAIL